MSVLGRLLPDRMAGRFSLLLAIALVAANLIALAVLSFERTRLDRAARAAQEIERIVSLVPAIEAVAPANRHAIALRASTRFSRMRIRPGPLLRERPRGPRSRALTQELAEALPGRQVRAAIFVRREDQRPDWLDDESHRDRSREEAVRHWRERDWPGAWGARDAIVVSIRLLRSEPGPSQWLNVVSRDVRPGPPGVHGEVFLLVLGLSLVAVLVVGLVFVRRLTRPLAQIAEAARAAGRGDRTARVPEAGAREMRAAAAAFNDMQARIARFDSERMRTLAAVGHDLRTPITSLRIRAELLDEAEAAPIIRTLDEMSVMADGLIAYAKGAESAETPHPLDLGAFLARLCDDRGAAFELSRDATVTAQPVALGRAIGNLIDNALRYGTTARVSLAQEADAAVVAIEDDGPGIPPERLERMFEPFVRGEESRNAETGGAGLGLSIARNIIAAHGGTVTIENRAVGGLRVVVHLPLTPRH